MLPIPDPLCTVFSFYICGVSHHPDNEETGFISYTN